MAFKLEAAARIKAAEGEDHNWLGKAEDKQEQKPEDPNAEFPEDFFKGSPSSIAQGLKSKSDDFKQAMSRLSFYINRAGKNLEMSDKQRLEQAKDSLYRIYGRDVPEKKPKVG